MLEILADWGYLGLFVGAFVAATVVPFSSDVLMVGLLMAGGDPVLSFVSATAGNWLGGLTSFWIGWLGKWEWIEKWFRVKPETLEKQKRYLDRYGVWMALLTWVPVVGDVIALALGFYKTPAFWSLFLMLIGKVGRFVVWTILFL